MEDRDPTSEELARVARYWQKVKDLQCEHETVTFTAFDPPTCGDCDRPVRMLSDIQIEEIKKG